jgi:hypothetical protein
MVFRRFANPFPEEERYFLSSRTCRHALGPACLVRSWSHVSIWYMVEMELSLHSPILHHFVHLNYAQRQFICAYDWHTKRNVMSEMRAWLWAVWYGIIYSSIGKSLCTYKRCWKWCPRTIVSKTLIKKLHTLPVLHFNRCLTTEYSETTAQFNVNFDTDNQIQVQQPKCTATFRTHCTSTGNTPFLRVIILEMSWIHSVVYS